MVFSSPPHPFPPGEQYTQPALTCPQCKSHYVVRVRRRLLGRLISLFYPLHRYRCRNLGCEWEGNITTKRLFSPIAPYIRDDETKSP